MTVMESLNPRDMFLPLRELAWVIPLLQPSMLLIMLGVEGEVEGQRRGKKAAENKYLSLVGLQDQDFKDKCGNYLC